MCLIFIVHLHVVHKIALYKTAVCSHNDFGVINMGIQGMQMTEMCNLYVTLNHGLYIFYDLYRRF